MLYEYRFGTCFGLSNGTEYFNTDLFRHIISKWFRDSLKIYIYILIQYKIMFEKKKKKKKLEVHAGQMN